MASSRVDCRMERNTYIDYFRIANTYTVVLGYLGFDIDKEWSASAMGCLISKSIDLENPYVVLEMIKEVVGRESILVIGAGPSIYNKSLLERLIEASDHVICANGSCRVLLEDQDLYKDLSGLVISVTDLDGGLKTLRGILDLGGYAFIHIHGDNIGLAYSAIELMKKYRDKIVITVQTIPPCDRVIIIPGFTDGDRAISLAHSMKPRSIDYIGLDFRKDVSSHYTKPNLKRGLHQLSPVKKLKLRMARFVLETLLPSKDIKIY